MNPLHMSRGQSIQDTVDEILKIVGAQQNKHYGFYQLCPKCDGWGEVQLPETSKPMFGACPVCNGAKLLVRPEIKKEEQP